ncbi:DUF4062 domain-containing protein [Photobacterium leiognathi]|uniref:DUF4062 domain-containing protein n=1 Tax=Photobacterium leiognathi TaxID=553611 RepID=UPI002982B199|nr:DUF4062 domain-containing protein [Photobacterium leiognathi]
MARPRVFISSTYYDLKYVRADVERFIIDQGFEPVLNEKGHIAYGSREKLEEYCYKEVSQCDILVSIIGGRYGCSSTNEHSVSNRELLEASKLGKQVYIFIESAVATEFRTFQANKNIDGIIYQAVDDVKVYEFVEEVYNMPKNNTLHHFSGASDIISYLKEQWAGLFQRLLNDESKKREINLIQQLSDTSDTLNQLVNFLVSEKQEHQTAINHILTINHPIYREIERKAKISFRVFFESLGELISMFESLGFIAISRDDFEALNGYTSWVLPDGDSIIRISKNIFDLKYDENNNLSF